jgi:hypothetical protein
LSQVRIPDTIESFPVVAIDRAAFPLAVVQNQEVTFMPVTDVFFPPTVRVFEFGYIEVIGTPPRDTPANLPNSLIVPQGVTHLVHHSRAGVNRDVFEGIRSVTLPNSLVDIPNRMFEGLISMTGITIPNSVERIGERAFEGATSLLRIDFPVNITDVAPNAFDNTSWLNAQPNGVIYVGSLAYRWKGDRPSNTTVVIRDGTVALAQSFFSPYTGGPVVGLAELPTPQPGSSPPPVQPVINAVNVILPDSLIYIGESAFVGLQMESIVIPNNVTHIGSSAFWNTRLINVTIGNSVTHIGASAFGGNQLTSITIPDSVTIIDQNVFRNNQLTSVTIPNSVTEIGWQSFENNQLTSVIIPDSVTFIHNVAFANNPLDEATQARIRQIQGR